MKNSSAVLGIVFYWKFENIHVMCVFFFFNASEVYGYVYDFCVNNNLFSELRPETMLTLKRGNVCIN